MAVLDDAEGADPGFRAAAEADASGAVTVRFAKVGGGALIDADGVNHLVWAEGATMDIADFGSYHGPARGGLLVDVQAGAAAAQDVCTDSTALFLGHGVLMSLGWGVAVPIGIVCGAELKRGSGAAAARLFRWHVGLQAAGLALASAGFVISVARFCQGISAVGLAHGVVGCVAMALGWLQPLNGLLRPAKPAPGQRPSDARRAWRLTHWSVGRAAAVLAAANLVTGCVLMQRLNRLSTAAAIAWAAAVVVAVVGCWAAEAGRALPAWKARKGRAPPAPMGAEVGAEVELTAGRPAKV